MIASVKTNETRNGNIRWTVTDDSGTEDTTFHPPIGQAAEQAEGSRARISFHEEERNGFRNVYLDKVESAPAQAPSAASRSDSDPDEAAWRTAVDAARTCSARRRRPERSARRRRSRSSSRSRTS